jgi:hypothetical protein
MLVSNVGGKVKAVKRGKVQTNKLLGEESFLRS